MNRLVVCFVVVIATLSSSIFAEEKSSTVAGGPKEFPGGWLAMAQRDEIRPTFSFDAKGGAEGHGAYLISTPASVSQNGWLQKSFPVKGGTFVKFQAKRNVDHVAAPFRSVVVRIVWQDSQGKAVLADVPPNQEATNPYVPLAEPEHPLDAETTTEGWTTVEGTYRVPTKATQALIELHFQWAPGGVCRWSDIRFDEVAAPGPRKVRLATIHFVPSGKSPEANCAEFAPLIAEAAKQHADLVVLGETVPYVRVSKKPHELAEPVPGPTTKYFGELAKQHGLYIVVGLYERDSNIVYNVAALLGPDGDLIGKYRKVCLPHSEIEAGITPGNDYPVFQTKFGKVGMMVCYDGFFPEVARELTNRGAEVIAWPVWGCNPLLGRARACENHVYVVSSTYTDSKSNWTISGVFNHAGDTIAKADKWGEIAIAEVDLNERYFWRNNLGDFHAMAQRHRPPSAEVLKTIRDPDRSLSR